MTLPSEATTLYDAHKLKELYELMAKVVAEHPDDEQVLWWHARACFDYGSELPETDTAQRKTIFQAGYDSAEKCRTAHPKCTEGFKYSAILLSKLGDLSGTKEKVANAPTIKEFALKAAELNPEDAVVQHILGAWCFSVANVSWLERQAAKLLFGTPPTSSFEEAVGYLEKARELRPTLALNLLLLGQTYVHLSRPDEARACFEEVIKIPTTNKREEGYVADAKAHLKKL